MKLFGALADYGFVSMRLTDDSKGADLLALHVNGEILKIQLKPRLTVDKKYMNKAIWIAFREGEDWYLYDHDVVVEILLSSGRLAGTSSWDESDKYTFPHLSNSLRERLKLLKL